VAFEFLGALFLANDETGEPVPESAVARLLACLLVATPSEIGTVASTGDRRAAKPPAAQAAGEGRDGVTPCTARAPGAGAIRPAGASRMGALSGESRRPSGLRP
jgi:hypothetical protein